MVQEYLLTFLDLVSYQLVGVALFLPFEIAFPKARLTVFQRADGLIYLLATTPLMAFVLVSAMWLKSSLGIPTLITFHFDFWSPVIAAVVAAMWVDLQFYIYHRMEHRFFWRFHAVHHSIKNLSAANSYHHWSEALMILTVAIPLQFIDVQIGPTLGALAFLFRYQQFYIHTSSRPHFGPFRWLLIDNRYHRIHHSLDPAHHDKNFGAMSPLWDWLFGTLYMPKSNEWPEVGLRQVSQPDSLINWHSLPWRFARVASPASERVDGDSRRS